MGKFFAGEATAENIGFLKIWENLVLRSAPGRRVKARARPRLPGEEKELENDLEEIVSVRKLWDTYPDLFERLCNVLESVKDPFYAIALLKDEKPLSSAELFVVGHLAFTVTRVLSILKEIGIEGFPPRTIPPSLKDLERRLLPGSAGQPAFYVSDSYSPELSRVRAERKNKEKMWRAEMTKEAQAVERLLGRRPGLREEIAIRKTSADLIEKARLMPELGEIRETVTHVHFRLKATAEAVKLEREINRLRQREIALEEEVISTLSREVHAKLGEIEGAAQALGELDFLLAKVELARRWRAVKPAIVETSGRVLFLEDAFHPEVKEEVESRGGRYQPVSVEIDSGVSVITGPNMGGKTVTLATVGLCVALAQWGLLVPCRAMRFSLYDYIYFQPQTGEKPGLSSFAVEIVSLKEPLSRIHERGLVLLDEVGRGTNPAQGLALYAALLSYFMENDKKGSTIIATTHYHGLASMLGVPHWQVTGLVPSQDDLQDLGERWINGARDIKWLYEHMDYRLQKVGPDTPTPQDALLVARVLGLEEEVVRKAEDFYLLGRGFQEGVRGSASSRN
ncbi:MAG TPA: hypothetical protein GXX30_03830 [Firmicutes bacterium]|nr:hypothetical protein [Candidatus Fermentithermobacillaceae bacterium]